ncbi:MAG: hypothetical protein OXI88_09160 [Gammaproteobacteria bacterium]|nr:hypothetical protein [Gammaproteobacteria bacterium]
MMKIVRLYSGDDGESHFQDIEIDLKPHGSGFYSELFKTEGVMFRSVAGDYSLDYHTAHKRFLVVNLTGFVDLEVGDGTVKRMGPGTVLLAEDYTGRGHRSKAVEGEPRTCLMIPLAEDVKLTN